MNSMRWRFNKIQKWFRNKTNGFRVTDGENWKGSNSTTSGESTTATTDKPARKRATSAVLLCDATHDGPGGGSDGSRGASSENVRDSSNGLCGAHRCTARCLRDDNKHHDRPRRTPPHPATTTNTATDTATTAVAATTAAPRGILPSIDQSPFS